MKPINQMTKQELIDEAAKVEILMEEKQQLKNELEKREHLAAAVDAKDKEITRLQRMIAEEQGKYEKLLRANEQLTDGQRNAEHLAAAIDAKDREIARLNELVVQSDSEQVKKLQDQLDFEKRLNERWQTMTNQYVEATRSYLKQSQGALDNMLMLDGFIIPKTEPQR